MLHFESPGPVRAVIAVVTLLVLCLTGCQEKAPPPTALRVHSTVAGYELRLAPHYDAEVRERGWTVTPVTGAKGTRDPIRIDVDVIAGPAPDEGTSVHVGNRRLRRSVETTEGGSSGEAVTLTYVEDSGPDSIRYQQMHFADGMAPHFELDELIRRQALLVVKPLSGPVQDSPSFPR
jgi:hypothetical protein